MPETQFIDAETGLVTLRKKPGESKKFDVDMTSYMASGDTISAVADPPAQVDMGRVTGTTTITIGTPTHDSAQKVQVRISAGTDGENYKITFIVTTTNGDSLHPDVMLYIREDF